MSLCEFINSVGELKQSFNSALQSSSILRGRQKENQKDEVTSDQLRILDHIIEILHENRYYCLSNTFFQHILILKYRNAPMMTQLARTEGQFLEQSSITSFEALGLGSFLHYCIKNESVIMDALGLNSSEQPLSKYDENSNGTTKSLSDFLTRLYHPRYLLFLFHI